MLLEFKVENFQCYRDEHALSLVPSRDSKLRGNQFRGHRTRALKTALIYGHNASGKTSLLHALFVMRKFVINSATRMSVGDPIAGVDPFRLAPETKNSPTCFEVLVELAGIGYGYRFEATRQRVMREELQYQAPLKGATWLTLIDRHAPNGSGKAVINLHDRIGSKQRREGIAADTRDNGLVLSRAAERNVDIVRPLYDWFRAGVHFPAYGPGADPGDEFLLHNMAQRASDDPEFRQRLLALCRDADTGIVKLKTESYRPQFPRMEVSSQPGAAGDESTSTPEVAMAISKLFEALKEDLTGKPHHQLVTYHAGSDSNDPVRFDLTDESGGTRRFLVLAAQVLDSCERGRLVVVDELDSSLHPHLARRVIQMFQSPQFNRSGAQLLATTHDTSLMDPLLLRRDQIWLTQKNARGDSEAYSLWDIENMPRSNSAFARNYLAGRYGAVPVFGPTLEDIPQSDSPTTVREAD